MENDILQNRDPFPPSVHDTCRILAGCRNKYNNNYGNRLTEANDGIAFVTTGNTMKKRKLNVINAEIWAIILTSVTKNRN